MQIQVAGVGRVSVAPDQGVLNMHIRQTAPTATEALLASSSLAQQTLDILDDAGIPTADRGATPSGIHRETRWQNEREVFIGWTAAHHVHATVRDLDLMYELVERMAGVAGVDTNGPHWHVTHDNPAHSRARHAAVAEGYAKAEDYAAAAGLELGPLVSISDAPGASPGPGGGRMMMAVAEAGFEPGTQEVTATVTLTFGTMQAGSDFDGNSAEARTPRRVALFPKADS